MKSSVKNIYFVPAVSNKENGMKIKNSQEYLTGGKIENINVDGRGKMWYNIHNAYMIKMYFSDCQHA